MLNVNAHLTLKDLIRSHRKYLGALQFCGCTSADHLQFLCVCVCVCVCYDGQNTILLFQHKMIGFVAVFSSVLTVILCIICI